MTQAGHVALIIAMPVALYAAVAAVSGARTGGRLAASARGTILAVFGLYTLALALVLYAFFSHDFSFKMVADHASRDLPALYSLSALYADKGGSMFFWGWLISLFTAIMVVRKKPDDGPVVSYALAVLAVIQVFYLAMVIFGINIFAAHPSPPADGFGLNPLLQNFGMLVHPPLLYIGFAAFACVFALVIGAVAAGRPSAWWSRRVRHWTLFAWATLGIGNLVGMWWSYNELGWGGYWAWDPVENAGLMPWLLGTAFLHSIVAVRRGAYMKRWGMYLIVFTFVFTLFSPFVTHGGIESPLHGFYGSPLPPYILAAMIIVVAGSLLLFYRRRRELDKDKKLPSLVSGGGAFLLTNYVLVVLVLIILVGTVLPRLTELGGGERLVLERSFFDRAAGPVMLLLVFLMGVCPLLGWGRAVWRAWRRYILYFVAAVVVIAAVVLGTGIGNWYILAIAAGGLGLFVIIRELWRGTAARRRQGKSIILAFFSLVGSNRGRYGGMLAHIGIILIALGVIVSSFYSLEKTVTLETGESLDIGGYELTYDELLLKQDNVRVRAIARVAVSRDGRDLGTLAPSYDYWFSYQDAFSEVAVRTTAAEDLFVSLVWTTFDPTDKTATFRVLLNPLIVWMWIGGGLWLAGGVLSFSMREKYPAGGEVR
jgi:cytochrome c-type biogenesis protein CcmF